MRRLLVAGSTVGPPVGVPTWEGKILKAMRSAKSNKTLLIRPYNSDCFSGAYKYPEKEFGCLF